MKQFAYVADRVMISVMSVSILIWIALMSFQTYHYFRLDESSWFQSSKQWFNDHLFPSSKSKSNNNQQQQQHQQRRKRTLKKHEDYWGEESEDHVSKHFPTRMQSALSGVSKRISLGIGVSTSSAVTDDNWDEVSLGSDFYSVHSHDGLNLTNRNL